MNDLPDNAQAAISRRSLLLAGAAAFGQSVIRADAQAARPKKIGWLKIQDRSATPSQLGEFIQGLRALGHEEGRSFVMEYRFADGDASRLTALAEELVRSEVDLIIATSQPATDAARRVTQSIPIVGRMTDDPVRTGAAQSLSKPAGNVSGVYSLLEEMSGKRLALLKQANPHVSRVGALLTLSRGDTAHWLSESQSAARQLGLDIYTMDVHTPAQLDDLFRNAADQGVNGLLAFRNPTVVTYDRRVVELAERYRMASIFDARDFVDVGGFMSYGPNLDVIFRRLADYADRILRGSRPGDLPIEQPTEFELVVNLGTAKRLGFNVASSILISANQIIE